jgi:hypothetical protein
MFKQMYQLKIDFLRLFFTHGVWSVVLCIFFGIGLLYLILPGPTSIADFPDLPNSTRSQQEGDTIQNPNISAYFSNANREDITQFYWNFFQRWNYGFLSFPLFKINHPPEYAYTYIRDQQESTGLEEYYRPMRESLFVNIHDALLYTQIRQKPLSFDTTHLEYEGNYFASKGTIRYYPSNVFARIVVFVAIFYTAFLFIRLTRYFRKVYQ